jgi:hypothetical protein
MAGRVRGPFLDAALPLANLAGKARNVDLDHRLVPPFVIE